MSYPVKETVYIDEHNTLLGTGARALVNDLTALMQDTSHLWAERADPKELREAKESALHASALLAERVLQYIALRDDHSKRYLHLCAQAEHLEDYETFRLGIVPRSE